ncbi:MAG: hypothetical protein A3G47_01000 [Candidatus Zambryskibacteria bacterium RIFCSPLOWO2_12_FULL_39_45]|uniref:ParB/Sulfiredoxin domain-containing protein n=3 Tax=Candidatus Zambryskiibacteriota TaxID=1817925 RepID=A0A1G2T8B9_9BACT|nr:MAG: hypothetical protein UT81_C0004G0040 [Parcubacteria group bacterium GW2011_GWA2_40_14]OHA93525.1 MAG: hypothetical protein A2W58_02445 [Candidatus Zambryskibacteria bacterium RIFCSPHIGHO2_02_38_10.5]OHA97107.1 MAG: hypothetical protein A3C63_01490 [Candidatus Zambryskibacteria bacterium RIFCSPHIGHO2_02_FULL_39_82]OHA97684.1 MAG: hypothetical protein A3E32_03105 [Candidatus Zambryskibacteria bacterium RIFCSPHIGHO2_12_FULL_38_37]OHB08575.1 MAG: hypothetical protein A2W64_01205 [Candidatus
MRVKKTQKIKLTDIKPNLFVRQELDTDHVIYLAQLIEGGTEMRDRIKVTEDLIIVDGRHRKEAFDLVGTKEIEVDVVHNMDEVTLISEAYKANTGGSKPPTPADTEHTVMLLLQRSQGMKLIGELLALPTSMARKYVNEVKSRMNRAQLQRATEAVTEGGLNIKQAAEQYQVDAEKLKEVLSGHKRKTKNGVAEVQKHLSRFYNSIGTKNARMIRSLIEKFQDGDVTEKQMKELFAHIERLQKKSARVTADWKSRFEAVTTKSKDSPAA